MALTDTLDQLAGLGQEFLALARARRRDELDDRERPKRERARAEALAEREIDLLMSPARRGLVYLQAAERMLPGLMAAFSGRVPDEMLAIDGDCAVIPCPCGSEPHADLGIPTGCQCGRVFLYDGKEVRVFRPEEPEAAARTLGPSDVERAEE